MLLKKNADILIVSLPLVFPQGPPVGPAILKSFLHQNSWSCETLDLNIELYEREDLRHFFFMNNSLFSFHPPQENNHQKFLEIYQNGLNEFTSFWAQQVLQASPQRVGLSLFSHQSAYFAERMIHELRTLNPEIPIVLGGPYVLTLIQRAADRSLFPENIDIIAGDGELALLKYLEGDFSYPGINSVPVQLDNLDIIPIPEYEQEQFDKYDQVESGNKVSLTISRGCVRRCSFCDIKNLWPKYKFRSAQRVFEEIVHLHERFDRKRFNFTDSLINGNIKMLAELSHLLIEKKLDIHWGGQFICRNVRSMPPDFFRLIADAGCSYVVIGIESGSEKVRNDMRKHFSNEDIYYNLEELTKVGIDTHLLMLFGYFSEGEKEFQETLDFFDECIRRGFFRSDENPKGPITRVHLGFTMVVIPETEAQHILNELNPDSSLGYHWSIEGNDRFVRLERLFRAVKFLVDRGYSHLITSKIGAFYKSVWEEFVAMDRFEKIDPKELDVVMQKIAVND